MAKISTGLDYHFRNPCESMSRQKTNFLFFTFFLLTCVAFEGTFKSLKNKEI